MWLRKEECGEIVREAWGNGGNIFHKIEHTAGRLQSWGKKRSAIEQTEEVVAEMRLLDARMDELEDREEIY
ncbi:hypothetical protein RDABS01_017182 [Bienertia sinuspersici]